MDVLWKFSIYNSELVKLKRRKGLDSSVKALSYRALLASAKHSLTSAPLSQRYAVLILMLSFGCGSSARGIVGYCKI